MEGLFFYWVMWITWVVIMFFIPSRTSFRFSVLFHLLVIMILSRYILSIYSFSASISGLYVFFLLCMVLHKLSIMEASKLIVDCFLVALCYVTFHLFALLDPVWIIVKPIYLQGFILNYLVILLVKCWKRRLVVLALGMVLGDLAYAGLLTFHSLQYVSLSYTWHDHVMIILIVHLSWSLIEYVSRVMYCQAIDKVFIKERQG